MKLIMISGAFLAMVSVVLGAFAAHGLKGQIEARLLDAFETAVQYQMYHALALLLIVVLHKTVPALSDTLLAWSAWFMLAGIVFFSGSLYALALTQVKWFGPITPIGGLCFIIGWSCLLYAALKLPNS